MLQLVDLKIARETEGIVDRMRVRWSHQVQAENRWVTISAESPNGHTPQNQVHTFGLEHGGDHLEESSSKICGTRPGSVAQQWE